jgi:hypothetical protein
MNLYKQKDKICALGIRMITWADRTKVPISNQENHIPEVDNAGNIVKYHKKPDGYYVVYNKEKKQQLRKWSDDFKWVSKKEFRLKQLIDVQEMTDEKHSAGVIQVDGLNKKEMRKANMLYDIYNPNQILMR